jgi:hypothetical protein
MTRMLRLGRRNLLMGLACSLGMIAFAVSDARAGSLELTVQESGAAPISILDNTGLDTNPAVGVIDVNVGLLNLSLTNYQFSGLSANSNSTVTPAAVASLLQTGTAQLLLGGTGSISLTASDVDYSNPTTGPAFMASSSSNTYTHADNGNSQGFTSWFNQSNTLNATEVASPTVTLVAHKPPDPNSHSGNAANTNIPSLTIPFGLTNTTTLTLTGGAAGALSTDQFTGSTTVRMIPEPASLALMLTALPVTLMGALRRHKAAQ